MESIEMIENAETEPAPVITVVVDGVPFTKAQLEEGLRLIATREAEALVARSKQYVPEVGDYFRWAYKGGAPSIDEVLLRIEVYPPLLFTNRAREAALVAVNRRGQVLFFSGRTPSSTFYQVADFDAPSRFRSTK